MVGVTESFRLYTEGIHFLSLSLRADLKGWGISPRGAGYLFGSDVVQEVCIVCCQLYTYIYVWLEVLEKFQIKAQNFWA